MNGSKIGPLEVIGWGLIIIGVLYVVISSVGIAEQTGIKSEPAPRPAPAETCGILKDKPCMLWPGSDK